MQNRSARQIRALLNGGTQTGEVGGEHENDDEKRDAHSHFHTWSSPLRASGQRFTGLRTRFSVSLRRGVRSSEPPHPGDAETSLALASAAP
jgi:hypothetical protein